MIEIKCYMALKSLFTIVPKKESLHNFKWYDDWILDLVVFMLFLHRILELFYCEDFSHRAYTEDQKHKRKNQTRM